MNEEKRDFNKMVADTGDEELKGIFGEAATLITYAT